MLEGVSQPQSQFQKTSFHLASKNQRIRTAESGGLGLEALTRMMDGSLYLRVRPVCLNFNTTPGSHSTTGSSEGLGIQEMEVGESHGSWPRCYSGWVAELSPEPCSPDLSTVLHTVCLFWVCVLLWSSFWDLHCLFLHQELSLQKDWQYYWCHPVTERVRGLGDHSRSTSYHVMGIAAPPPYHCQP